AVVGVIGTGGAYPTNWSNNSGGGNNPAGVTVTIVGTGTEPGIDFVDIRWNGTPNASSSIRTLIQTGTSASPNDVWCQSIFTKLAGGTLTNVSSMITSNVFRHLGSGLGGAIQIACTAGVSLARFSGTGTAPATTDTVDSEFQFAVTNGQAVDLTVRIGWPQLELGSFATSPIRTTGGAAARASDVVTLGSSPMFGTSFSFFAQGTSNMTVGATGINSPRSISVGANAQNDAELFMSADGKMNDVLY